MSHSVLLDVAPHSLQTPTRTRIVSKRQHLQAASVAAETSTAVTTILYMVIATDTVRMNLWPRRHRLPPNLDVAGDTVTEAVPPTSNTTAAEQAEVTRRYDRMARIYDVYDAPMEWMGTRKRRRELLEGAHGAVLEVGVGTGKNLPFYPQDVDVTGIDVSSEMLARAKERMRSLPADADLIEADVQELPFDDDSFDTAVGTCVFCSVADPVLGLRELARVVRPDGRILLLEHVRPSGEFLGRLADLATVVTRRVFGFRANRRTEDNVVAAGLKIIDIQRNGVWRTIVARPGPSALDQAN